MVKASVLCYCDAYCIMQVCGPQESSYVQIPNQWGSKKAVRADNFLPVQLENFSIDLQQLAEEHWDGRALLLFVMKDGSPGTKVQAYVTEQPR